MGKEELITPCGDDKVNERLKQVIVTEVYSSLLIYGTLRSILFCVERRQLSLVLVLPEDQ